MSEVSSPQNQEALNELCRLLRFSQGEFALILAVCNSSQHRQALVEELRQQCPISFDEITLSPTASTLFTTVNTYIKDVATAPPEALMVYDLSEVEDPEQLLIATNQIREEFREFSFPLVLWLTDNDHKHLIRTAPDFYTWANQITFDTPSSFFLSFIDELIQNVWQQVTQSQENRFLTTQDLGLTATSANYRELETSLAALVKQDIKLPIHQAADLEFVRGRIANNNSATAREHYEYSLEKWKTLVTGEDDDPRWREKMGHVQFYMGLWWRNHAERHRPDFELAFGEAREYFAAAIETFEGIEESEFSVSTRDPSAFPLEEEGSKEAETLSRGQTLAARYINYLAEALHRLERWADLEAVATKAKALHQTLQHPFRVARAEGFLAEVALARKDWTTAQQLAERALELIQSAEVTEKSKQDADFYSWINSFHRGWYLFSLGKAQFQQEDINSAVQTLEKACGIAQPDYDPKLYSLILAQLQQCYFQQGLYLPAFETRRQRDAIESRFNYRAFVGAGRLQPKQQIANPALPTQENRKDAIVASGRKQDVQKLVKRLSQDEYVLTIVYGPSGVGKSSLIEAGLVPALEQGRIETRRVVPVYLRRYRNWVEDLVQLLTDLDSGILAYRSDIFNYPQDLLEEAIDTTSENTALPEKVLRRLRHHTQKNQVIVLVFDQFEEFFFEFEQTAERRAFYDFLGTCLGMPYVKVVLSLREDYIHYLLECDRLTDLDIIDNNILDKKWLYYIGNFKPDETKAIFNDLTYPTPYTPEQELVERVVDDLAAGAGEVRPIELQIVGAQLQAEGITTPEIYYNWGDPELSTKELLVQKYLTDIVDECGPQEHQDLAEMVLYLLTDEKGTRPLKTESDLAGDLQAMTNQNSLDRDLLSLILKILTESGLVTEVPEAPEERYQLVHDYLAAFIRSLQQPLIARIEKEQQKRVTAEQRQIEEQQKRLAAEQRQRKIAQRAAAGLAVLTLLAAVASGIAWVQQQKATKGRANAQLLADSLALESALIDGLTTDDVVKAMQIGQDLLSSSPNYYQTNTRFLALAAIQKVITKTKQQKQLIGHVDAVESVIFSPDGEIIASASDDNTIKLWTKDGKPLNTLKGHTDAVESVIFSPDGEIIASASDDNTIKLWTKDGKLLNTFKGHIDKVSTVVFSPDDETIASASHDSTIKLWTKDGKLLKTLKGHAASVRSLAFSPDGEIIASASYDRTIKLWSKDGELLKTFEGHTNKVTSLAFSPDGKTIASASEDTTIKLWSKDGKFLKTFKDHNSAVIHLAFSPDGKTIASAGEDTTIKLWSKDGEVLTTLKGHTNFVLSVAFSPDGETIASASADRTIKLWSKDRKELNTFEGHTDSVRNVAFSPDSEIIASASADHTIKLWTKDGKELTTLKGHNAPVLSLAFSSDNKILASASADKTIKLWTKDGKELTTLKGHTDFVRSVAFSPNGEIIASASNDGTIKLWSKDGDKLKTLKGHNAEVMNVTFSPDGETIASTSADNNIKLWSKDGKELKTLKGHTNAVMSVAFSPDGEIIASASHDGIIKLWSKDGKELKTLKGHTDSVRSVAFSPNGEIIASASHDGTIKLWSKDGEALNDLQDRSTKIWDIAFSPNGEIIVSASSDSNVKLWRDVQFRELITIGCNWLSTYFVKQSPEALIELEICQEHTPDLKHAAASNLVAKADRLAQRANAIDAIEWYKQSLAWDNRLVFTPKDRAATIETFEQAIQLIETGNIETAISNFKALQSLNPPFKPTIDATADEIYGSWNELCWIGSLQGYATEVMFACEKSVDLAPYHGGFIDSRGLARALTGNTQGAIADFKVFVEWTSDEQKKVQRQAWIDALEKGDKPFNPKMLEALRDEE
ncbi:WD40 repeat-containing protein [Leptolyngbya sp. PCC 7375]|nr:WD40 repeat-containing protein [Leptolyngbya sp. PCC 7375]